MPQGGARGTHYSGRWAAAKKHDHGHARLGEIKLVLGLFPWNTWAALSSVLGGEKVAQVFEVFDSLTQAGHLGREFSQRRLVRFLQGVTHKLPSFVLQHTRE
jgi:hypothetical protein